MKAKQPYKLVVSPHDPTHVVLSPAQTRVPIDLLHHRFEFEVKFGKVYLREVPQYSVKRDRFTLKEPLQLTLANGTWTEEGLFAFVGAHAKNRMEGSSIRVRRLATPDEVKEYHAAESKLHAWCLSSLRHFWKETAKEARIRFKEHSLMCRIHRKLLDEARTGLSKLR